MATIDILSALKGEYDSYNNASDKHYYKLSLQKIAVTPRWWKIYGANLSNIAFNWVSVKFLELEKYLKSNPTVGNQIGVYLFVAKPDFSVISLPSYVFYVGIAGEHGSGVPVRERLKQYLQQSVLGKRSKVLTALELYHPDTYVYFSELNVSTTQLSQIEKDLHGYFMPWANTRDFPTPVKKAKEAW